MEEQSRFVVERHPDGGWRVRDTETDDTSLMPHSRRWAEHRRAELADLCRQLSPGQEETRALGGRKAALDELKTV